MNDSLHVRDVASQICGTPSSVSFWSSEALLAARVTDTAETNGDALTPSVSATELVLMFAVKAWDAVERSVRRNGRRQEMGMSCAELGAERETTVDQALIRGLVTAFRVFVSGLSSV